VLKINWNYIKSFLLLALVVFLYGFSNQKNKDIKIHEIFIEFEEGNNFFMNYQMVNKLLIQNEQDITNVAKEILDLNELEIALNSNVMIKKAQVYLTVNGEVRADVVQRKPIARVSTNAFYYIDDEGLFITAKLFIDTDSGMKAYNMLKKGVVNGLSIGYKAVKSCRNFARIRYIQAVELFEISLVNFPSNGKSRVMEVKDAEFMYSLASSLDAAIKTLRQSSGKTK